jgi:hypothetical protein
MVVCWCGKRDGLAGNVGLTANTETVYGMGSCTWIRTALPAALEEMRTRFGSIEEYFRDGLGTGTGGRCGQRSPAPCTRRDGPPGGR